VCECTVRLAHELVFTAVLVAESTADDLQVVHRVQVECVVV